MLDLSREGAGHLMMRIERFGPAKIFRSAWEMERQMRTEARVHLFQKFRGGIYREGERANSIIQHQFAYFSAKLNAAIPILAARDSIPRSRRATFRGI
jgi:hypothetical protein